MLIRLPWRSYKCISASHKGHTGEVKTFQVRYRGRHVGNRTTLLEALRLACQKLNLKSPWGLLKMTAKEDAPEVSSPMVLRLPTDHKAVQPWHRASFGWP